MVTVRHKPREAVFRAIADPTRRQVLNLLRGGRLSVGEIAGHFRMSRPAVSKHLRMLRSAHLIVTHQVGAARICELNAKPLRAVDEWLLDYKAFWADSLRNLKHYAEEEHMNQTGTSDAIVEEIEIKAPAERVFEALVNPEQRLQWWPGSKPGSAPPTMESDLRPGGKWVMRFESWGDKPSSVRGEYRAIERPRVLSFTWRPDWYENPSETLVRFDLTETAGITTVRITHSGLATKEDRASHRGWPRILAALHDYAEQSPTR